MGLLNCKCPACGGDLKINENAKGMLRCPFCGSEYMAEEAITQVTNNINVTTVNNYSGATIIGGKEDFVMERGVLLKYNGNDTTIVIPEGVREFTDNLQFGKYTKKIILPSTLEKLSFNNAKFYFDYFDGSKNPNFRKEEDVIFFKNEPVILGPNFKEIHLKEGEELSDKLFLFFLSNSFVTDFFLPKTRNSISRETFERVKRNKKYDIKIHIADMNTTFLKERDGHETPFNLLYGTIPFDVFVFGSETRIDCNNKIIETYVAKISKLQKSFKRNMFGLFVFVGAEIASIVLQVCEFNDMINVAIVVLLFLLMFVAFSFIVYFGMNLKSISKEIDKYTEEKNRFENTNQILEKEKK